MKFLIAGLGMLGVHVVTQLHAEGHQVEAFDVDPRPGGAKLGRLGISVPTYAADVTDFVQVASTADLVRPEYVINTSVSRATDRPALMAKINVMGLINLLEASRIFKISRLVHASSTTVYGTAKRDQNIRGRCLTAN